VFRERISELE
jgi:hypothetical protein